MSLTSDLKEYGEEVGLDRIRVTTAEPLREATQRIKEQIERGLIPGSASWRIEEVDSFCDPRSVLSTARSVVAAAECYLTSEPEDLTKAGEPHGRIARYTWRNYYEDVLRKLKKLGGFLTKRATRDMQYTCYSNGPLAEKPMAQRAGIGWYGKHGIIVTSKYGSWVVLGELITDLELEPDEPLEAECGGCEICVEACPTGAVVSPAILEKEKCIQYLTNWRGIIPAPYRGVWGTRLYGCTTCQDVCPLNLKARPRERKPDIGYVGSSVPLIPLLAMGEAEYRAKFAHNQMGKRWVHKECVQRNAVIALGNICDPVAVPALVSALGGSHSMVRAHAAWALGKIGGKETREALERARSRESDGQVKEEIEQALGNR